MFWDQWERISGMDLTLTGVDRSSDGKLYVGGISVSDKQSRETDTSKVSPRFARDMFRFPDTIDPTGSTAS
jgi:hypothetical protein